MWTLGNDCKLVIDSYRLQRVKHIQVTIVNDMGYTKLFGSIVASSIWQEDAETKVVWITMLALKNERHMVEASVSGLAKLAGVSRTKCEEALKKFEADDPDSRSTDHGGKKIKREEGGWLILNGEAYAHKMSADERREYQRVKQAEYRKRRKVQNHEAACEGARQAVGEGLAESARAAVPGPAFNGGSGQPRTVFDKMADETPYEPGKMTEKAASGETLEQRLTRIGNEALASGELTKGRSATGIEPVRPEAGDPAAER